MCISKKGQSKAKNISLWFFFPLHVPGKYPYEHTPIRIRIRTTSTWNFCSLALCPSLFCPRASLSHFHYSSLIKRSLHSFSWFFYCCNAIFAERITTTYITQYSSAKQIQIKHKRKSNEIKIYRKEKQNEKIRTFFLSCPVENTTNKQQRLNQVNNLFKTNQQNVCWYSAEIKRAGWFALLRAWRYIQIRNGKFPKILKNYVFLRF